MTLPTTDPTRPAQNLNPTFQAVQAIIQSGQRIKSGCDDYASRLSNPVSASLLLEIVSKMSKAIVNLTEYRTAPALDEVARTTIPGYTGSLAADTQATIDTMQQTSTWMLANIPKDANGWVLAYKWNADGTITERLFSPSQTAGLVTALAAIGATIG